MTTLPISSRSHVGYRERLAALIWQGIAQIVRPASHSHRAEAARAGARRLLALLAAGAAITIAAMLFLDATEIGWMPARGTASLWPLRVVTDFGKATYVLSALTFALACVTLVAPRIAGPPHAILVGLATRLQFLLIGLFVSVEIGELLKGVIGRGRPFVGGEANAFNFSHFAWSENYASFPSGHAVASVSLAVGIAALWPHLRVAAAVYALVIVMTRLVLLAHHPSDVVAGALVGACGMLVVRYWFAARRLGFIIRRDGSIAPRAGPSAGTVAKALRRATGF